MNQVQGVSQQQHDVCAGHTVALGARNKEKMGAPVAVLSSP